MSKEVMLRISIPDEGYYNGTIVVHDKWGHSYEIDVHDVEEAPPEDWEYYYNLGKVFEATHGGLLISEEDSEPGEELYQCQSCKEIITEKEYKKLMDVGMPYCMCEYAYTDENEGVVYTRILNEYKKV